MNRLFFALCFSISIYSFTQNTATPRSVSAPTISKQTVPNTAKPWTFWWWMGSTVTEKDITWQLENFAKAGLGGVHIIPIYGVKGLEKEAIPYLSPQWMQMLTHTIREGKRLGLGVDMTTGTGWPFGGPNVTPDMAAKKWQYTNGKVESVLTKQAVKRAAPGGAGLVLDPFASEAVPKYVQRFDSAFATVKDLPRAMYNDSYEVYGANWTDDFPNEFKKRRGYDLQSQWAAFMDTAQALVRIDYHQTLAELLAENYAKKWTDWSRQKGFVTRYQAHGSPGNLLDLYALSDIPETESFGSSRFPIKGLRVDDQYEVDRYGTPNPLAMKFASSPAHLLGKKLVSSESTTWLANHFKVSLSQIKPQLDELFTAGINHIFYHGTTYSPKNADYPGWLFYASTNYGMNSHFWKHYPLLNRYVERCQTILQNSQPDNDLLVYFPIHDLWATQARAGGGIHLLEVHHVDKWLLKLPFGKVSEWLWNNGFAFDFISDDQLQHFQPEASGKYKTVLIPATTYLPETTLARLGELQKMGVRVIFMEHLPKQPTGFYRQKERNEAFQKMLQTWSGQNFPSLQDLESIKPQGLEILLTSANLRQETWAKEGLKYIRKVQNGKVLYFIANQDQRFSEGWITLATSAKKVALYQPLTDKTTLLPVKIEGGKTQVYLTLRSGESCFLRLDANVGEGSAPAVQNLADVKNVKNTAPPLPVSPQAIPLQGTWKLEFLEGKPYLPKPVTLTQLGSWASLSDSAGYFSGTARYSLTFDLPKGVTSAQKITLDLGDVREVADVTLNGKKIGTAWSLPFRLDIPANTLKTKQNRLLIEVTNLSANYMRLRDAQQPEWKKFQEINVVDIQYKPFNAAKWSPMPSGLLSTVTLEASKN
ncbi:glycosyl hydrolase [Runella slithyformis]|uniref:Glycoside hydrolase family 2 sugar binding protein n=1 Tax=Runella slithyformis (strain ATCC 29530 / DSM 19594 / LMG 11500 / NCIMB 11436 / LSU 4) TaxID=761193 RepID=A0A7U3ZJY3_RUNSL|nr:glycosyl hydrolase [Runella slithyformis]AEI48606.1 glycoside hydrolase family 2 sugar binding protein [Runella slithyformis DSM 19594]